MNRPLPKEPELKYEEFQFIRKHPVDKKRKRERVDPWLPEGWAPSYADEFVDPWAVPAQYRDNLSKSIRRGQEEIPRLQYYHSRNRLPMRVGDWHVDSDDESDNEWIDQLGRGVRSCLGYCFVQGMICIVLTAEPHQPIHLLGVT